MNAILESSQPHHDAPGALSASALALVGRLHASLDPAQIVRDFAATLVPTLAWQGLVWLPPLGSDVEPLFLGRERACQCHYALSAGGQPLGELTLSRRQPFTPDSIEILEELLCGLVFPLRNALLYQSARRAAERLRAVTTADLRMASGRMRASLPAEVLARTDVALHAARNTGRNQVVHAG